MLGNGLGVPLGVPFGDAEGLGELHGLGLADSLAFGDGLLLGSCEGSLDGSALGAVEGHAMGDRDGDGDGDPDGDGDAVAGNVSNGRSGTKCGASFGSGETSQGTVSARARSDLSANRFSSTEPVPLNLSAGAVMLTSRTRGDSTAAAVGVPACAMERTAANSHLLGDPKKRLTVLWASELLTISFYNQMRKGSPPRPPGLLLEALRCP